MMIKHIFPIPRSFLICICCLLFNLPDLVGQETEQDSKQLVNIIPPSPTATSLGKYGDIPVSLYTGTPNISVPLYTLASRELSVPIGLSYHASGIKVDEIASWVGLGWSLNAGGVITRTIKGLPDEEANGYRGVNNIGSKIDDYLTNNLTTTEKDNFLRNAADGFWDTEPDVFHFNIMGNSGKLIFDLDGSPVLIPQKKLKIEGDVSSGFILTTADGMKYTFDSEEKTDVENLCSESLPGEYTTAWYLTRIEALNGDFITFSYVNENHNYIMNVSESKNFLSPTSDAQCSQADAYIKCESQFNAVTKRLERIETANMVAVFEAQTPRLDLNGSNRLDALKIYNKEDLANPFLQFQFSYSYFTPQNERLRLEQVQELSGDGSLNKNPFKFAYQTNVAGGIPGRLSTQQDHWGFFNSNTENTLIPDALWDFGDGNLQVFPGADRSPDPEMMKACALTEITYPTGGSTYFEFEAHDYGYLPNLIEVSSNSTVENSATSTAVGSETNQTESFSLDFNQLVKLTYSINQIPGNENPDFHVAITDASGNLNNTFFYEELWDVGQTNWVRYIQLNAGSYQLIASCGINGNGVAITVAYEEYENGGGATGVKKLTAGGLRIKKMTHYNGLSTANNMVKEYKYHMEDETDRSSGVLISQPNYGYNSSKHLSGDEVFGGYFCNYFTRTASSQSMLGTTQGSHVGYREITVYHDEGANGTLGRTQTKFISPFEIHDELNNYDQFPFPPITSYDFRRGMLDLQRDFTSSNKKVRELDETYTIEETTNKRVIDGLKVGYTTYSFTDDIDDFAVGHYQYISEWFYKSSSTERIYPSEFGDEPFETQTQYQFNNPNHLQLSKEILVYSNDKTYSTNYYYPEDYSGVTSGPLKNRIDKHIHVIPVETIRKVNDEAVSGTFQTYKSNGVLPNKVYALETTSPLANNPHNPNSDSPANVYQARVSFDTYDNFGNLQEQHLVASSSTPGHDTRTFYLYGRNSSVPVAKVESDQGAFVRSDFYDLQATSTIQNATDSKAIYDAVRTVVGSEAFISTYGYNDRLQVVSMTDTNRKTTSYEYDGLGRLTMTRDHNNDIVQKVKYNFKNTP